MKIISMYLPQFHRTKENDEWWGTGYTDWEAVKIANPLFKGHYQPRKPYNDNYYNLLEKRNMQYQAELMEKYSVYGQCFYHYWFKNGRKVLNKPVENLLEWKDINMPFCFCWANESWVRSWSAIVDSNVWAPKFEPHSYAEGDNGILLEQDYGDVKQWEEHFDYFVPFFMDERYIRINNMPVVMIFRPENIPCLEDMVDCWKKRAVDKGLMGIYVIGANTEKKRNLDALYIHATGSMFPPTSYLLKNEVKTISYDDVWKYIVQIASTSAEGTYVGGLVDFDTTARKGKNGVAITDCKPDIYKDGLMQLLKINAERGIPYTFINAWNEWGEGMYLEPDSVREFSFLEATRDAVQNYNKIESVNFNEQSLIQVYKDRANQYKSYWRLMDFWMRKKEDGISLTDVLYQEGYKNVAIYGIGILGQHLMRDINPSIIKIDYFIDARKKGQYEYVPILGINDELPLVDVIIVSVISEYDEIRKRLKEITKNKIISLEDLVFEEVK